MRILIILLAMLSLAKADATITVTLTGAGDADTKVLLIVSDADGARIVATAVKSYSPITIPAEIPANDIRCQPSIPGVMPGDPPIDQVPDSGCFPTFRPATENEAMTSMFRDMFHGSLLNNVVAGEKANAAKVAVDAVVPIEIKSEKSDTDPVIVTPP